MVPTLKPFAKSISIRVADIPELYHWTSIDSLGRLQAKATGSGFPFEKIIAQNAILARSFPQLSNRKGVFTWNNPIGGMGASSREMYEPEQNDAVVRFKMKKNLKILVLQSVEGVAPIENLDLTGVDVIFHSRQWNFHEFIILNPAAIEEFTSDPDLLRPEIEKEIEIFRNAKWQNDVISEGLDVTGDLYNFYGKLAGSFDTIIIPRVQAFLTNRARIPSLFKAPAIMSCKDLF